MNQRIMEKLDRVVLYAVIYTTIFITFYLTMPYILPFVLGTIIALIAQGPINLIVKRFKAKRGLVGVIVVLVIFAIISALLAAVIGKIVTELIALSNMLPNIFTEFKNHGYKYLDMAASYYNMIDPTIIESIKGSANKIFSSSFTAAVFIVNFLLDVLKSLPGILMLILFTLLSAVYIAIDLPKLKDNFFSLFSKEDSPKAKGIILEANKMLGGYLKAYLILISITFIQTYIGTSILKVRYALIVSVITSISDLLPILGPGTILIPLGAGYIIAGRYLQGIGILIIYLIILIVRQILEPKVVSSSLGVYPLAIVAAIFIGIKAYGLTGMIFTVFFVVFYVVLQKVGIL